MKLNRELLPASTANPSIEVPMDVEHENMVHETDSRPNTHELTADNDDQFFAASLNTHPPLQYNNLPSYTQMSLVQEILQDDIGEPEQNDDLSSDSTDDDEESDDEFAQFDAPIKAGLDDHKFRFYSAIIQRYMGCKYLQVNERKLLFLFNIFSVSGHDANY